jgi:hypothetical protein
MDDRLPTALINRLSRSAGCTDPMWLASFLKWATSEEDAKRSIRALRVQCSEKWQHTRERSRTFAVDAPVVPRASGRAAHGRNMRRAYA